VLCSPRVPAAAAGEAGAYGASYTPVRNYTALMTIYTEAIERAERRRT